MSSSDSFRTARWIRTLNLVLQAVLFVTLSLGLNYLARGHAWRFDLTRYRSFSLSAETLSYIKNLPRPVHIVVSLSADNDSPEVRGLVDEYTHATEGSSAGKITKEFIDVYQNRRRAEDLGLDQANLLLLISGDKRRAVPVSDLYVMKNKVREKFQGEQALTAAVLEVSNLESQRIYFLSGHGELRPDDPDPARGLSVIREQLRVRAFQVDGLDLTANRKIPDDAALLVAVQPQSRYTPAEQEMLRQYLSTRAGRLILFLAPGITASNLGLEELLLDDWGVLVDDDLIFDRGAENVTDDHDLIIRAFAPHPISQMLIDNVFALSLGPTRSVRPDPGRAAGSGLTIVPLAATSTTAWGEVNYRAQTVDFDPRFDIRSRPGFQPPDRLSVVVASERVSVRDNLPFSVPGGRLVVFGTGDLIANGRFANVGNTPIFLNAVNWSVDRDAQLNIPPRAIERFQLALSAAEFARLRYALLLFLPGGTLLLGLIVYWTRRV